MSAPVVTLLDVLDMAVKRTISRKRGKHEAGFTVRVVAEWDHEHDDVATFLAAAPAVMELARSCAELRRVQNVGSAPRLGNCPEAEAVDEALDVLLAPAPATATPKRRK
jgi:hypothetical protein